MDILSLLCSLSILITVILLFFGLVIGIIYHNRRKHNQAWRETAQRAGLNFQAPSWFLGRPTLSGRWHDRPLQAYTIMQGSPRSGGTTTTMYVEMSVRLPADAHLQINERNLFSQFGQTGTELPTSDPEFDQRFVISGEPPTFVHRLLSDASLQRLLLHARHINIQAGDGRILYKKVNAETEVERMLALFTLLFDLAEAIERS